ncbi:unnamed protein product [Hymenolepis diminuta]|uniref:Uncharacterized protein n=1 Tax=Hymenolepis diminuta TaxID=6216 RepID=A0A564Y404_HYMDI|nr:unnamed protein product [Hymenolepis diminuta]
MAFGYHHIHILPTDYDNKLCVNTKSIHFQSPGPDNQTIILQLSFQKCQKILLKLFFYTAMSSLKQNWKFFSIFFRSMCLMLTVKLI